MTIDPDNPVVKLCADGMRAEAEGPMSPYGPSGRAEKCATAAW